MPDDLLRKPALELADLVRSGEVSSRELTQASLDRIEATEPLNHWTLVDAEGALAAADAVKAGDERPFAGVPIALKDLFLAANGLRMAQGSDLLGDFTPDYDAAVVRRFRAAGFVLMGRTQTPEFGILPVTEPRRFGPARNPWDPERTTGGSSGGSAGAVAGG
ncbi:MAG: amidase, partial [Thermoleophilaceae bacterium]|nr:amidase [Thermoleophilaceae bacterium]